MDCQVKCGVQGEAHRFSGKRSLGAAATRVLAAARSPYRSQAGISRVVELSAIDFDPILRSNPSPVGRLEDFTERAGC